jgi:hypothetical protein
MPLSESVGMPEKKASNAAKPPADAPMPTTGKLDFGRTSKPGSAAGSAVGEDFTGTSRSSSSGDGIS